MSGELSFKFYQAPKALNRSPEAEAMAQGYRSQGYITGFSVCLGCYLVSNVFYAATERPKDWILLPCPKCNNAGAIFLPDAESLDDLRKVEQITQ